MKKILTLLTILFCMNIASLHAQSYDELWEKVENLENDDKPQSVLEAATVIYKKAKQENCFPQLVRAKMRMVEKECDLDPERFLPQELEQLLTELDANSLSAQERAARQGILHCLLGNAYLTMMDTAVHDFDQETQEDHTRKAKEHFTLALQQMDALALCPNEPYLPLIELHEDGTLYHHTLLITLVDFILDHAQLEQAEQIQVMENAASAYQAQHQTDAAALLKLRAWKLRYRTSQKAIKWSREQYRTALLQLLEETRQQQAGIYVAIDLAPIYSENTDERLLFIRSCIQQWKGHKQVADLQRQESSIMQTFINLTHEKAILPGKPSTCNIQWKNATTLNLTVREYAGSTNRGFKETGKVVSRQTIQLTDTPEFQQRRAANLPIEGTATCTLNLQPGHYILVGEGGGEKQVTELRITSLQAVCMGYPQKDKFEIRVLDIITGRPVAGAAVLLYRNSRSYRDEQQPQLTLTTDKEGKVMVNGNYTRFRAVKHKATLNTPQEDATNITYMSSGYEAHESGTQENFQLFTDRSIYRPGQDVHVVALAYRQHGDEVTVLANQTYKLTVMAQGEELYQTTATTNALGSLDLTYTLPKQGKLGMYSVTIGKEYALQSATFHVEEYKRPTFDITFPKQQADEVAGTLGDTISVTATATHFSGVPVQEGKVHYKVMWGQEHPWYMRHNWQQLLEDDQETQADGTFTLRIPTVLPQEVNCQKIAFRIMAEVTNMNGELQSQEYTFRVKNPAYKEAENPAETGPKDELTISHKHISPTQGTDITFTAQETDALVWYAVIGNGKIALQGSKVLHGDALKLHLDYKKEWGQGVSLHVFYVRNGHLFHQEESILLEEPDKQLNLTWKTFRDKLIPGQQEEWILTVKDSKGRTQSGAELAAVMYDASLDALYPHTWDLNLWFNRYITQMPYFFTAQNGVYLYLAHQVSYPYYRPSFDMLKEFEHKRWFRNFAVEEVYSLNAAKTAGTRSRVLMSKAAVTLDAAAPQAMAEEAVSKAAIVPEEEAAPTTKPLRTNLQELAFFYPHIVTDAQGDAHISFTLPDCLTEWKFMALAHTDDMHHGKLVAQATAKKDFMVQPNLPRFLRAGDKAEISATLMNLCEHEVSGEATLRILSLENEQVYTTCTLPFQVAAGAQMSLTFPVEATMPVGDYSCEIIASDGKVSDGERNHLPVLSTRVPVVENVPFYLDGPGTQQVDLSALYNQQSASAQDKTVSISYTDNPALSVFQSLQALQNPAHENAPAFAASLYANLVLCDMHKQLGTRMDFNPEQAQQTAQDALDKLQELQLASGAWTWFKGMDGNAYITLAVAEHLYRLQSYYQRHGLTVPGKIRTLFDKAIYYLEKEELRNYRWKKEHKLPLLPSEHSLRYLLISSISDAEMTRTYLNAVEHDFKNLTIYGRANSALLLKKHNRTEAAKRFTESIKEYTLYKPGFGRYFATDIAYYSWQDYRVPTQLAAMRVMDNRQYLLDMQLWLLRQKQTQLWENPLNAIDVADYLLTNAPEISLQEPQQPVLKLNGKSVQTDSVYTGMKATQLQVSKQSQGISWGNVRATFTEESASLNTYSSGELTISRKVIREGNKVTIRHIIHADRDMDFVTVKSDHAACLEPLRTLSGYQWMGGRGCYLEIHDAYINLFFDHFTRGTSTIDMEYYITRKGEYSTGMASVECSYAPEFGAHTSGEDLKP